MDVFVLMIISTCINNTDPQCSPTGGGPIPPVPPIVKNVEGVFGSHVSCAVGVLATQKREE